MIRLDEQRLRAVLRDLRLSTGEMLRCLSTLRLGDLSKELKNDLLAEATRHASLLDGRIGSLLDLAELSVVDLTLDFQEVDLHRLLRHRHAVAQSSLAPTGGAVTRLQEEDREAPLHPLIADPVRIARMIDLVLQVGSAWARQQTPLTVTSGHSRISTRFALDGEITDWHETWWKGTVRLNAQELDELLDSLRMPQRAFRRDTVQSLQLIHLIAQRHGGKTEQEVENGHVQLRVQLSVTGPEKALLIGLESRLRKATAGIARLAVVRLRVPEAMKLESYGRRLREALLRASDAIFPLAESSDLVVIVADCTPAEIPHFLARVVSCSGEPAAVGWACCPGEGIDAEELLLLAEQRLEIAPG